MKRKINLWDYAGIINERLGKGVLLTTKAGDRVNSMTIGWGMLGIEWGKSVFVALVRRSRYTKTLLDQNPEFTVNVPLGDVDKNILGVCGTKSGRDMDKIAALGLTLEEPETVSVPAIRQLPLTLECKVIYRQEQSLGDISPDDLNRYYGKNTPNEGDVHTAYYGQITGAYIVE